MKITIMRDQLIAALCTAATTDIRQYLNGIYVEATSMETRIVATDGTVLSIQRADAKGDNEVGSVFTMIVPRAAIDKIKKHPVLKTVEINNDGGAWGIVDGHMRTGFTPTEGYYPDYRRILPTQTSGETAQFDPALIAAFAKAAKILGATYKNLNQVVISHNGFDTPGNIGRRTALVTLGHLTDYIGAISPLAGNATGAVATHTPAWAFEILSAQEELV